MRLSTQEADLFYELMLPLQYFVNQGLKVSPSIKTLDEYVACSLEEKTKVRDALYKNPQLIDLFVAENPRNFSEDKLVILGKWKDYVKGEFFVERYLKKHAIFITDDNRVYAVCGLRQGFDEIIDPYDLPVLVKAVLLPFLGRIIYDGLFNTYSINFGGGIRRSLREQYLTAKQNNRIIDSFESPPSSKQSRTQPLKDWEPEINDLYERAKHLKAGSNSPMTHGAAFGLVKAGLEFAQAAVSHSKDLNALYKSLDKVRRELKKAYTIIGREEE
ncbi:MAG: hypothetical protein V2B18_06500 [Pseudomonadota bacterium]